MLPGLGADDPFMKLGLKAGSAMQGSQKQLFRLASNSVLLLAQIHCPRLFEA